MDPAAGSAEVGRRRTRAEAASSADDNDEEEVAARSVGATTDYMVFIFFNFIFFGFFFRACDISTRTRKSDFYVWVRHPHTKITIFAYPWVCAGCPPV
jgi:hypothetical protein